MQRNIPDYIQRFARMEQRISYILTAHASEKPEREECARKTQQGNAEHTEGGDKIASDVKQDESACCCRKHIPEKPKSGAARDQSGQPPGNHTGSGKDKQIECEYAHEAGLGLPNAERFIYTSLWFCKHRHPYKAISLHRS